MNGALYDLLCMAILTTATALMMYGVAKTIISHRKKKQ